MIVRFSTLQKRILRALDRRPPRTITDLASRLDTLRPSVSRSLQALRKSGYIAEPGKGWVLTDKGKEAAKGITLPDTDITSQVRTYGYDEGVAAITRCACGQTWEPWDFILSTDFPTECPNCKRSLYCSIAVRVYEIKE